MTDHSTGTREEWQEARDELAKLEAEHAELGQKVTEQRRRLPWVPVDKEYEFDTQDGKKTLAELFDGRSQLLAYNIMYGPDYEIGACPGCSNLGDELDATRVHLNHRDVTLICFSRAPIDRLNAYKERMGWEFPYVSTYATDFPFDFGLALTPEQAKEIPPLQEMITEPPEFLQKWSKQTGAKLEDGLREAPAFIAFARDVALHIAGSPGVRYVSEDEIPQEDKDAELRVFQQQAADKPENVRERIAEGKLRKWMEDVVLLHQPHINGDKYDGKTIEQIRAELSGQTGENVVIRRFSKFQVGA